MVRYGLQFVTLALLLLIGRQEFAVAAHLR